MPLSDKLIAHAENRIAQLEQGIPFTRDQAKDMSWDLIGMKPGGLELVAVGAQWLRDLSNIFQDEKDELHPWVMVYGASIGMQGVFAQIVMIWVNNPTPQGLAMHAKVRDAIDTLIKDYLRLVS